MGKYLKEVLKEMCKRVGADYDKMDFKKPQWFWEYEWTKEEEDDFIDWMTKYLKNSKGARDEIMEHPRNNLKHAKKTAQSFAWNFGWRVKDYRE